MSLSLCALRAAAGYVPPVPPPSFIVQDTFTRANASVLGTSDSGHVWTAHTGTWGIDTNKAKLVTQSGDSLATVDAGVSDFDMSCVITRQGAPGIVFRFVDTSNWLLWMFNSTQMQIWRRQAGSYSQLNAFNASLTAGGIYTFRVTGVGTTITTYLDGVQLQQITTSLFTTATRYGLRQNDTAAARYDDFTVS